MSDPITVRPYDAARGGEEGYVLSTWLRDLRDSDGSGLPDDIWFPAHRLHALNVLADPRVIKLVAVAADDPDDILGYAIGVPGEVLEWIHVRGRSPDLRGRGLALRLLTEAGLLDAPTRFRTRHSHRVRNPHRPRDLRRRATRGSGSASSGPTSGARRS